MADEAGPPALSLDEQSRYLRHLLVEEIGVEGQLKLKRASVLCVGAGGLGCPALLYLAAAGVGRIGIVDPDVVDASNLQRQVLYDTSDVGEPKAVVAARKLRALNPHITVEPIVDRLSAANAERLLSGYAAIMDGTDNFSTRYLVNDLAIKQGKPSFFGCIFQFTGQVSVFTAETGCYRCVFPAPPSPELAPDCARAGVLGVLPGMVGTYQALELLKWFLGLGECLTGKLLAMDTLRGRFRTLAYQKNPECPACKDPSRIRLEDQEVACATGGAAEVAEITVQQLHDRLRAERDFLLLDVREPAEYAVGNLGGELIPLDQLEQRASQLPEDRQRTIIVHCRSGARSAKACSILARLGYTRVFNVKGGVVAWKREIDPSLRV